MKHVPGLEATWAAKEGEIFPEKTMNNVHILFGLQDLLLS